mgnify:CR=1 FL=1
MRPKVSVIVPVYRAEKDIARCCRALFGQTLDQIEYIFVDDCSPDDSVAIINAIIEEYPQRKQFVKILHQHKNSGVSACRQLGLDNATGKYVIHCDSDDWTSPEMYELLYQKALSEHAEVVYCDYWEEYGNHAVSVVFPDAYVDRPSFNICPIEGAVWNKLISRTLINRCNAKFYEGINLGEDFGFVTLCRVMSQKNAVLHQPLYHYNQQNLGSITHNYTREHFMQVVKLAKKIAADYDGKGIAHDFEYELNFLKFQSKSFFLIYDSVLDIKFWKDAFPECNKNLLRYDYPLYIRIAGWLIAHNLSPLAWSMLKIKKLILNH